MTYSLYAVAAIALGAATGAVARRKGHSFFEWAVFGAILFIFALPMALRLSDANPRCPFCAERVRLEAVVCPHCGRGIAGAVVRPERRRALRPLDPL